MGLKGAILGAVANATISTIATHGEIKDSKPTVTNKKGKLSPAYEFVANSKSNCLVMEEGFFDMYSLNEYKGKKKLKYHDYDGDYKFFDKNGTVKYLSLKKRKGLEVEIRGKNIDKNCLFDLEGNLIGRIKEHFVSACVPVLENDAKTCSVFLGSDKLCSLRRYYKIGKEHFEISGEFSIEHNKNKEFLIKKGRKSIAKIIIFRFDFKDRFLRSLVIEYDDPKNELIAILLAMAINTACYY